MAAKKQNFTILQGETFLRVIRWETLPYVYKPIEGITKSAPVSIKSVDHGLVSGWRAAVVSVKGMTEINAKHSPPRESELKSVTRIDADNVSFNEVNSAEFTAYKEGGYLQFYTPVDLTGYSANMDIKDRVGGTVLATLTSDPDEPELRAMILGTITLDIANNTITLHIAAAATQSDVLTWTRCAGCKHHAVQHGR
jgi:hypothetical protein